MCGYRVLYKVIVIVDEMLEEELEIKIVIVLSLSLFVVLENLDVYIWYEIEVLVFIIKGDGVKSEFIWVGIL